MPPRTMAAISEDNNGNTATSRVVNPSLGTTVFSLVGRAVVSLSVAVVVMCKDPSR